MPKHATPSPKKKSLSDFDSPTRDVTVEVRGTPVRLSVRPDALTVGMMRKVNAAQKAADRGEGDETEQILLMADLLVALVADWDLAEPYSPEAVDALSPALVSELVFGTFEAMSGEGGEGGEGDSPNP